MFVFTRVHRREILRSWASVLRSSKKLAGTRNEALRRTKRGRGY
jgi:hypothetical protein